jgi:hypothetical protein
MKTRLPRTICFGVTVVSAVSVLCAHSMRNAQSAPPPAPAVTSSSATAAPAAPVGATPARPCASTEHARLDFWVGSWLGTWRNTQTGKDDTATNVVVRSHDGCVIHESFRQNGGLIGSSYSVFDARAGAWRQTWVDNTGAYLDFTGAPLADGMSFARELVLSDGKRIQQRMRFINIGKDAFDWVWERSRDGGARWEATWSIRYQRTAQLPPPN